MSHELETALEMLNAAAQVLEKYQHAKVGKRSVEDAYIYLTDDVIPAIEVFITEDMKEGV